MHLYTVRVGYADTDRMGFAHHSRYLVWAEEARTEMIRAFGDSYHAWEERGILLPLTNAEVEYLKPSYYDELLTISTVIDQLDRLRLAFRYVVRSEGRGVDVARIRTAHVYMTKEGKPQRMAASAVEEMRLKFGMTPA